MAGGRGTKRRGHLYGRLRDAGAGGRGLEADQGLAARHRGRLSHHRREQDSVHGAAGGRPDPPGGTDPGPLVRGWTAGHPAASRHAVGAVRDRKSTRLNSSHVKISYAVFCLKKKITMIYTIIERHQTI